MLRQIAQKCSGALAVGLVAFSAIASSAGATSSANATSIRTDPAFSANIIPPNDDGSSPAVTLPFTLAWQGSSYDTLWVNNNGNLTFSDALSAYTPQPFATLGQAMIAPFWADVDTRGGNGTVGYGIGTVNGHQAFGATWDSVGYYNQQGDKRNTFQVVLISRPDRAPGAFDVEFNYSAVTWETGDASGGSGGFGGFPARAGTAVPVPIGISAQEVDGSGQPGKLLDGDGTGLTHRVAGGVLGRISYQLGGSTLPAGRAFVALGDSYSSGEGAPPFDPDSNVAGGDQCHRSSGAYSRVLATLAPVGEPTLRACSGAVVKNLFGAATAIELLDTDFVVDDSSTRQRGEHIQFYDNVVGTTEQLGTTTRLVTLTIGGNDLGFRDAITACYIAYCSPGVLAIDAHHLSDRYTALWTRLTAVAPNADVYVLGYPRLFPKYPYSPVCDATNYLTLPPGAGISIDEQLAINRKVSELNNVIKDTTSRFGRVHFVNVQDAMTDHETCSPLHSDPWMNGLVVNPMAYSYHPNLKGQRALGEALFQAWQSVNVGWLDLAPDTPVDQTIAVADASSATFRAQFASSAAAAAKVAAATSGAHNTADTSTPALSSVTGVPTDLQLISPSGRIITPTTADPDIQITFADDTVAFRATAPEDGTWTLRMTSPVAAAARTDSVIIPNEHPAPAVSISPGSVTGVAPLTVHLTATTGDTSPALSWNDGQSDTSAGTGSTFSHTYTQPGTYDVSVLATDPTTGAAATARVPVTVIGKYTPVPAARVLDTRIAVGAGKILDVKVTGGHGVPASGVNAVVVNLTAYGPSRSGSITAYPTGAARPGTPNLNYTTRQTISNLAVVKVGSGGKIRLYNTGTTRILADINGWIP
jgi:lysophospholipase L1-like esterase